MNYFVAYTYMTKGTNLFCNTVLEVDKSIETIEDIQDMEDRITKRLNVEIKDDIEKGTLGEIKGVKIINYREIEKGIDLKVSEAVREGRKKTTVPDEIFDTELRRVNKRILRMLKKY